MSTEINTQTIEQLWEALKAKGRVCTKFGLIHPQFAFDKDAEFLKVVQRDTPYKLAINLNYPWVTEEGAETLVIVLAKEPSGITVMSPSTWRPSPYLRSSHGEMPVTIYDYRFIIPNVDYSSTLELEGDSGICELIAILIPEAHIGDLNIDCLNQAYRTDVFPIFTLDAYSLQELLDKLPFQAFIIHSSFELK